MRLACLASFFPDTLENKDVGVNGHADGEHDARDARHGERGTDRAEHAEQDDDIQ